MLFALLTVSVAWAENLYVRVTDPGQLADGKKVILAHVYPGTSNSNSRVSIASYGTNAKYLKAIPKTATNLGLTYSDINDYMDIDIDKFFDEGVTCDAEFTLGKNENGSWTLTYDGTTFIGYDKNNDLSRTDNSDSKAQWTITKKNGGCILKNNYDTNRSIQQTSYSGNFMCYDITNTNYYDAYLYVQKGENDPSLAVSNSSVSFSTNPSGSFTISGSNLTEDISVSIKEGAAEGFSVTPSTITPSGGTVTDAEVTITYRGTTKSTSTATIVVSSGYAMKEVVVKASSSISASSVSIGTNPSKILKVSGKNLGADLNLSIKEGSDEGFSFTPTTIPVPSDGIVTDAEVTVTYRGSKASATGYIVIRCGDGDLIKEVKVTGTAQISASTSVSLGTNPSKTFNVSGKNLANNISIAIKDGSDNGFSVTPETIEVVDGVASSTPVTVSYNGTDVNATATIVLSSGEVIKEVSVTASHNDVLFTTAGNYYIQNQSTHNYVQLVNSTLADVTATTQDDADIITLDFNEAGAVSVMKQYDGDGDMIATLDLIKRSMKEVLEDGNKPTDFLDQMFTMKMVMTGDDDGSVYLCVDVPAIENFDGEDGIRNYLIEHSGGNQAVNFYLSHMTSGKRHYLCVDTDNKTFGFSRSNGTASKWQTIAVQTPPADDVLFITTGKYYIKNKGNNKYVVITGTNEAEVSAENKDDASIVELDFDSEGFISTMKNADGEGDVMATLVTVKSVLKNKLGDLISDETLDEIFAMKLVDTGDGDGSVFLCLDIPVISNIDAIRNAIASNIANAQVKEYLNEILQPGKRIYMCVNSEDNKSIKFTRSFGDESKWLVEKVPDNLFTTPGNYYVNNKGNGKYVVITGTTAAEVSASDTNNATLISLAFNEDGTVKVMKNHDGEGDIMATLVTVKEVLENKLSGFNTDFIDEMFKMRLVDTGDGDGSVFLCMDIPAIEDIEGIRAAVTSNVANAQIKEYLLTLLQPGKRVYVCVNNGDNVGFTLSSDDYSKWMAEKGPDDLFTEAGSYYINNKGNTKYVVVTGTTAAEVTAETEDDATIIDLAFNEDGTIKEMKNHNGEGDVMTTLETVKSVLKNKLGDLINDETLDEIFAMKLVDTGDDDGSVFLCLDIPAIANIDDIRDAVESNIANAQVKEYLNVILQPGKRVYLCVNKDDYKSVGFTLDNDDYSKWMATKLEKIEINEENFPDPAFRQYVHDNFDKNGNWWLSQAELDLIKDIDVGNSSFIGNDELKANVVSVQGIEFFENLEKLILNGCTKLESVDVSQNQRLSSLKLANTLVSELDLTNNTELRYLDLNDCNNLKEKELDLSTCENIHWIEIGKGQKMTIKGLSGKLNLGRLVAEGNYFEDNILDLTGCETLTHLNVLGCDLDKLILKGCKNIGTGIGTLEIYSNKLRALDLEGVPGTYKFKHGTGDIAHNSSNTQISPTYKPDVTLIYIDRDKTPIQFTYVVYFRLDNTQSEETEGSFTGSVLAAGPTDFTMDRVKRWIRLEGGHASMTSKDLIVNDDKIEHIKGTKQISTMGLRDLPEGWAWDNSEVPGEILALGFYSVPQGAEDQTVEGKIAYAYDTKKDVTTQDPVYNGEITAENEFFNTNLGDDEFPFDVNWSVKLTDNPDEVVTGLYNLDLNKEVSKVTYVNLMGVESDRPFEGVNIVVTRYTDGTVSTYKVIK